MDPVYMVSGVSRSGSSMAFAALVAGGLRGHFDSSHETHNMPRQDGYLPNPDGFYALDDDITDPTFAVRHAGALVKVSWQSLLGLPNGAYQLLFMLRDPAEIEASMDRFGLNWGTEAALLAVYDDLVTALRDRMLARGDIIWQTLRYPEVVADPVAAFGSLGWPIDATRAAIAVKPALYRFRLESK